MIEFKTVALGRHRRIETPLGFGALPNRGQAAAGRNWLTGNSFVFTLTIGPGFALDLSDFFVQ